MSHDHIFNYIIDSQMRLDNNPNDNDDDNDKALYDS